MMAADHTQAESVSEQPKTSALPAHAGDQGALRRFLLVGCERSGSTMFRLMLDHHPELSCMYESDFMVVPYERCRTRPTIAFNAAIRDDWHFRHSGLVFPECGESYEDVIRDFFRQRMYASGKKIIGATVQHGFHHLPNLFPDARYIHLLRDGRPVAASMINMGWVGNTYYGARRWRDTVEQVLALQRRIDAQNWLTLRYEDLLRDAEGALSRVCQFLGIPLDKRMLAFHEVSTYAPLDPSNATRWKKRMSPREILEAEMGCGNTLHHGTYDRMFPATIPHAIERCFLGMGHRAARMRFNCRRFGTYLVLSRRLWRLIGVTRPLLEQRFQAIRDAHII